MPKVKNKEKAKRNQDIINYCNQGYDRQEAAVKFNVSIHVVNKIMGALIGTDVAMRIISKPEHKPYKPFRPDLHIGQEVTLNEPPIVINSYDERRDTYDYKYTVKGIYPHHVLFERKNQHVEIIKADYQWEDLRSVLKMKGERVA